MHAKGAILAAALVMGSAAHASGQVLSGRLLEAGSNRPIASADVRAISGDTIVATTQSDTTGTFLLVLPASGTYSIRVDRIGYAAAQSDGVEVGPGEIVETMIRLSVAAVPLPPVMAVERRSVGASVEFYRRLETGRRTGLGEFITRDELDAAGAAPVSSVLSRVPQVGMEYDDRGMAHPVILARGGCSPTVYLNGSRMSVAGGESIDEMLEPATLEGVEIYRNRGELPQEYAGTNECGAIAMWTRPGGPTRGGWWRILLAGGAAVGLAVLLAVN